MSGNLDSRIGKYMEHLLVEYDALRGREPQQLGKKFWDMVVISAGDQAQAEWYREQVDLKHQLGDLPTGVPILCIPDPLGTKIGSGGATLNILSSLLDSLKEKIYSWRILIIHSGGYSKRLPSHSCTGKIFSPLPILPSRGGPYQMLDLKLALYLPFMEFMESGVFVASSDDIEVFFINSIQYKDGGDCVTALAHPSSLDTGATHGVYVMQPDSAENGSGSPEVEIRSCLEVLQKPSVDLMKERGAVQSTLANKEQVYSDSAFWFTSSVTRKLIQFYQEVGSLPCELCIYGDFLTFLGTRGTKHFVQTLLNAPQSRSKEVKVRLGEMIGSTPLNIIKLNLSKFYHLGTSKEYLEGLTENSNLRQELNMHSRVHCRIVPDKDDIKKEDDIQGVILNSSINANSVVPKNVVVEYSLINAKVRMHPGTILSSVVVDQELEIPGNFLYHSVPIREAGVERFVTIAFGIEDDLKLAVNRENLQFGGRLVRFLSSGSHHHISQAEGKTVSLWEAKLFPAGESLAQSFLLTVNMVVDIIHNKDIKEDDNYQRLYSMAEVLELKNCAGILNFRKHVTTMSSSSSK